MYQIYGANRYNIGVNNKERVFQVISQIPEGKVMTYAQVAKAAGLKSPRVVGNILHRNERPDQYPCHRVVRADGSLATGYAYGGPEKQAAKLRQEGVVFHTKKVDLRISLYYYRS